MPVTGCLRQAQAPVRACKALYIAWARLPSEARRPKTLGQLARVIGLRSDRTIRKWRHNNPEIDKLVQKAMLTRVGVQRRPAGTGRQISASWRNPKASP